MNHSEIALSPWRERILWFALLAVWSVLVIRLLHVQFYAQDTFASQALQQQVHHEVVPARPGDIVDRKGRLLATTIRVPSLYVNPSAISDIDHLGQQLGDALSLDQTALTAKLNRHKEKKFLWVKRHLSAEEQQAIQELKLPSNQAGYRMEFKRFYPQEALAAHVIGLRDIDGNGRGGVEQTFHSHLSGREGLRRYVRDARGNVVEILEEVTQPPQNGKTLVLTIDTVMQLQTENVIDQLVSEYQPVGACAIVLDPRNGEVLAMTSRPAFAPRISENTSDGSWKNLAISAIYEPGSTFKPLVIAWGLERGLLKQDEMFHCHWGKYRMGRRLLHDHHPYGELSLTDVIVKSSNIGMAQIGERLGNEQLFSLASSFGFGQRTGIELPGELSGLLRTLSDWNSYSTGSIPMGHEIAVTPLQMITAHAVLANGGRKISPHLKREQVSESRRPSDIVVSEIVSRSIADWVIQVPMQEVVQRGTGKRAQISGINVFGKTGTAQKVNPKGGYYSDKNVCSFICGAPAERPRILVLVCVDEPQGDSQAGGIVAAPAAAEILQYCLSQQY